MDNQKYFFRIIIPNYNNFLYIKRCLDSIVNQTFTNYICIIIDDVSSDNSVKIAEIYARQHTNNFIVIHSNKRGYASTARNIGLNYNIDSEYTWFIDSDDFLPDNMVFQRLYNNIIQNKFPDAIRCSYKEIIYQNQFKILNTKNVIATSNIDKIMICGAAPWKTCHKSSLSGFFVENIKYMDDVPYLFTLFDNININKISIEKTICYVYNRNTVTSTSNNSNRWLSQEALDSIENIDVFLNTYKFKSQHCLKYKNQILPQIKQINYKPQISLKEFFKNSFMISIDKEKINLTKKIFLLQYDNYFPNVIHGYKNLQYSNQQNCLISHLNVIKYAKQNRLPFVVIFEDDAYPKQHCKEILERYLKYIPKNANIVLLGWSRHCGNQSFQNAYNLVSSIISGAHAYIVFENAYDTYIKYASSNNKLSADNDMFSYIQNVYIINKPIFIQYNKNISMHNHKGYIYYGDHTLPPEEFLTIDKIFKPKKYITFCNGNLGNQLYYVLQAYIKTNQNLSTIYSMRMHEANKGIYNILCNLNMDNLVSVERFQPEIIKDYCQIINKNFTLNQLENFISNTILKNDEYLDVSLNMNYYDNTLAINIRNGDFLIEPIKSLHDCFDRFNYLKNAINDPSIKFIKNVHIFSDDIKLCKKMYHNILKTRFHNIIYDNIGSTILSQFIRLSKYKYKIIWNSTFSIWTAFIGDILYKYSGITIYPSKFMKNENMILRCNPIWKEIKV